MFVNVEFSVSLLQMGGLESVGTGIIDEFGSKLKKYKWHREFFMLGVVLTSFCISLASVTHVCLV